MNSSDFLLETRFKPQIINTIKKDKEKDEKYVQYFKTVIRLSSPNQYLSSVKQRSPEWYDLKNCLDLKYHYISATDAATVLKIKSKNKSAKNFLSERLMGIKKRTAGKNNIFMDRGTYLETLIIRKFIEVAYFNSDLQYLQLFTPGIIKNPANSTVRLYCSPDLMFFKNAILTDNEINLIEAKYWAKQKPLPTCFDEIPLEYIAQVVVQLMVTDANSCFLVILAEEQENWKMVAFNFSLINRHFIYIKGTVNVRSVERKNLYCEYEASPLRHLWLFQQMCLLGQDHPKFRNYFIEYQELEPVTHDDFRRQVTGERFPIILN